MYMTISIEKSTQQEKDTTDTKTERRQSTYKINPLSVFKTDPSAISMPRYNVIPE
jgi:hypothetical protein